MPNMELKTPMLVYKHARIHTYMHFSHETYLILELKAAQF